MTQDQANRLCSTFNENFELHQSFWFKSSSPLYYGKGLAAHLSSMTGQDYSPTRTGKIKPSSAVQSSASSTVRVPSQNYEEGRHYEFRHRR